MTTIIQHSSPSRHRSVEVRTPLTNELNRVFDQKYGPAEKAGPNVRLWKRVGYYTPDEHYEALVSTLVNEKTVWLDVGCGRGLFPTNLKLAAELAGRCARLVGIDPDDTIHKNSLVHDYVQATVEDFTTEECFTLITMRMVAEHISDPQAVLTSLRRLLSPGGVVVLFTPFRWSPLSLAARLLPHRLHHPIKHLLWRTQEEDTFRVEYKLNTRRQLRRIFSRNDFEEVSFQRLADCASTWRFPRLHLVELAFCRAIQRLDLPYPEHCILAAFQKKS
ncbi:MAG: methyltransferase domain-containing protein [Pirellulales bacterium]|nr:methyltransferase domain-containing protein [Pirellulales bacterium]